MASPMRFFDARLHQAFPSYSGLTWINGTLATNLLNIMLRPPLKVEGGENLGVKQTYMPVWWTRGHADFTIEEVFVENEKLVINGYEFKINRIAVHMGRTRFENFIYVETDPDDSAYGFSIEQAQLSAKRYGYASEEFGFRPSDGKIITRTEYDNNGYVTDDGLERADDFELRTRYTTRFNFIITHKTSYYHSKESNDIVESFLKDSLLKIISDADIEMLSMRVDELKPRQRES